jgi:SAM-dependent methyltransferase
MVTKQKHWLTLNRKTTGNVTATLDDAQLDPPHEACPFCLAPATSSQSIMKLQTLPPVERLRCKKCCCTYSDRQPTSSFLSDYYGSYYAGEDRRSHIDTTRMAKHLLTVTRAGKLASPRLLDFGGGDGGVALEFLSKIRQSPLDAAYVAVVDYNSVRHPRPPSQTTIEHFQSLPELTSHGFNFVLASAVLEHVKDLRNVLQLLLQALAVGGRFYARTPYAIPLNQALGPLGIHFDTLFPAHIFDLGSDFWEKALSILGFSENYRLTYSRPALVETQLWSSPATTTMATLLKAPWYILGNRYRWVGGWEVVIERVR